MMMEIEALQAGYRVSDTIIQFDQRQLTSPALDATLLKGETVTNVTEATDNNLVKEESDDNLVSKASFK